MEIIKLNEIENFKILKKNENNREIRLYKFKNVEFSGFSNFYPDVLLKTENKLVLPYTEMKMSTGKENHYIENGMKFDYKNKTKNILEGNFYFFIYENLNYYHFIYDTLPYLYAFLSLEEQPTLVMSGKILPFVKESLELLGVKHIIQHEENNVYTNLFLSNSLTHDYKSNEPPRKEIFEIYKLMKIIALNKFSKTFDKTFDKIYISRRTWIKEKNENIGTDYTTRRKMVNEDQLVKKLKSENLEEIFGEDYSMVEKILLFSSSKLVVGAIGGTITNCVFCNPECRIISIVSPTFLEKNKRMEFLFNKNVVLFDNTELIYMFDDIAINMRVLIKQTNKIGEIQGFYGNMFILNMNWENFTQVPILEYHSRDKFEKLDNGINSPWKINIEKFHALLKE